MNNGLAKGLLLFVLAGGFYFSNYIFTSGGEIHVSQQAQLDAIRDAMQADAVTLCIKLDTEGERKMCLDRLSVPKRETPE